MVAYTLFWNCVSPWKKSAPSPFNFKKRKLYRNIIVSAEDVIYLLINKSLTKGLTFRDSDVILLIWVVLHVVDFLQSLCVDTDTLSMYYYKIGPCFVWY